MSKINTTYHVENTWLLTMKVRVLKTLTSYFTKSILHHGDAGSSTSSRINEPWLNDSGLPLRLPSCDSRLQIDGAGIPATPQLIDPGCINMDLRFLLLGYSGYIHMCWSFAQFFRSNYNSFRKRPSPIVFSYGHLAIFGRGHEEKQARKP